MALCILPIFKFQKSLTDLIKDHSEGHKCLFLILRSSEIGDQVKTAESPVLDPKVGVSGEVVKINE